MGRKDRSVALGAGGVSVACRFVFSCLWSTCLLFVFSVMFLSLHIC